MFENRRSQEHHRHACWWLAATRIHMRRTRQVLVMGATLLLTLICFIVASSPARASERKETSPQKPPTMLTGTHLEQAARMRPAREEALAFQPFLPLRPTDLCNPLDPSCFGPAISQWAANAIMQALAPVIDAVLSDQADIIFQTPLLQDDRLPQNQVILSINTALSGVVDAALASLLVIGAYTVVVGHHVQIPHAEASELIPRAILVVGAVHLNVFFLQMFIQFENALCLDIIHVASDAAITNTIQTLFTQNVAGNVIAFVLLVILAIMVIFLLIQMIVRLALVALCLAVAPLGLGCFLLPQTLSWGRLWLSTLSAALVVQVLQVLALSLAGVFATALAATSLAHLGRELALLLLVIGTMTLVLKIPGMLHHFALRPMLDGLGGRGGSSGEAGSGDASGGGDNGGGGGNSTSGGASSAFDDDLADDPFTGSFTSPNAGNGGGTTNGGGGASGHASAPIGSGGTGMSTGGEVNSGASPGEAMEATELAGGAGGGEAAAVAVLA